MVQFKSNGTNQRMHVTYRRQRNAEEMKHQVLTFVMMLLFTLLAFAAVAFDFSGRFIKPLILLLAVVQVIFQLYYFMHMKHRGHGTIALFFYSGLIVGIVTVLTFVTLIWI